MQLNGMAEDNSWERRAGEYDDLYRRLSGEHRMNVIFIEPSFPPYQKQFVRGLAEAGATVIGIGERPRDWLDDDVGGWLSHYEQVSSVVDVDALESAVRFIQSRIWVDRLEATIEAHVEAAAAVRERCGIPGTSVRTAFLCRDKPAMKEVLRAGRGPHRPVRRCRQRRAACGPSPARSVTR